MSKSAVVNEYHNKISNLSEGLRARTVEAEELRRIPDKNISDLRAAGLFRVFQSKRFGGAELSMAEVLPLVTQVARDCPSTAWVMAVLQIHAWLEGLFPEKAQQDVYTDAPESIICGVLQPKVTARKVEGGYELDPSLWPYSSGCDHASWIHLGGLIMNEKAPPDAMVFLIPKDDYEIVDDWHVVGLRGTGSKSIRTNKVFVPEHRAIRFADAISGELSKGHTAIYHSAILPMLCLNVTAPALGAAQSAIEIFIKHIENRNQPFSILKQVDSTQTHHLLGEVMLQVESAQLMLEKGAALTQEYADEKKVMPLEQRSRVRAYSSAAVRQCVAAIESLFLASGGTALQDSHPLQRLSRDSKAMAAHAALSHENNLELWGAVKLDKPLNSTMV